MSLLKQAPRFDVAGAVRLARDMYGLEPSAASLSSERDQNFLLTTAARDRYVLKIANASERREMLEAQNAAMVHVADRVPFCQRVLPTLAGDTIGIASENPHPTHQPYQPHFVRLVTYIAGVPLAEVDARTPALLDSLGRAVGRLDRALADFDHPAAHRDFHWDLAQASRVIGEHLQRIGDDDHRNLVERASTSALAWIAPLESTFRRSVIHNDANDWNVLAGEGRIVGIIDFGDMVRSWTVADPAVAIAYAMLDAANPLETAAAIARGYHTEHSLRDEELAALFPLATLRLCMSACIAAWQQQQRPDDEYLTVSQAPIQRTLPRLADIPPSVAERAIRDACAYG
jgi:Ser/Thr protein kinase RdoA (MazF antagonist)